MRKFLNPRNDVAFKRIFGSEKNKDILIALINEVLKKQFHKKIVNITFLSTFQDPENKAYKQSIIDIMCEDEDKCKYIIEMQVAERSGFEERAQYYAYKAYVSQMKKGDPYEDLKEVIFLAFTDYEIFPQKEAYKSEHITLDRKTYEHDLDKISFTFVDLVKFNRQCPSDLSLLTLEEKFYYFLSKADDISRDELKKLIGEDTIINRAFEELDSFNWEDEEWKKYEAEEKGRKDNFEALVYAEKKGEKIGIEKGEKIGIEKGEKIGIEKGEKIGIEKGEKIGIEKGEKIGIEKGEKIGIEKGEKIGIEKGEKIGIEKGKVEGIKQEKIEIAKNMLNNNIDISVVMKVTGLKENEVQNLYKKYLERLP